MPVISKEEAERRAEAARKERERRKQPEVAARFEESRRRIVERERAIQAKKEAGRGEPAARRETVREIREEREVPLIEEERRGEFAEVTRAPELREELEEKITTPPELAPPPITLQTITPEGKPQLTPQGEFLKRIVTGKATKEEITKEIKNFATGLAITGVAAAAVFGIPYIASAVATSSIAGSVTGATGSIGLLKAGGIGAGGVALWKIGGGVFDFRGGEMDILRQGLKKVVEDGERIEAAQRNGLDPVFTISTLRTMSEEVDAAESRIKELGIYNANYRISREYILDMQNARSAREAILRRISAAENIAATGVAAFNPEALMFNVSQFEEGEVKE